MPSDAWQWDQTLYAGSAAHYTRGRLAYPPEIVEAVRDELGLDGQGRLLDVGCGPGSLTLLLAPLYAETIGVDADPGMIEEARRRSAAVKAHIDWRTLRAEELAADLGTFRTVTFAQSFHWMDQALVAGRVRDMLTSDGAWVHVHATTHRGVPSDKPLPGPPAPWDCIDELVAEYLGPVRRAGQSTLPNGTASGEEDIMRRAGFTGPVRVTVGGGQVVERSADQLVSAVFSLSSSAPHLFGERVTEFEGALRDLLAAESPNGIFAERTRELALVIWRI